jgi:hypothetical protein
VAVVSEAPNNLDWPEAPPLDVEMFSRFLMKLFDEQFRKQADYAGLREVRYSPDSYSDMRSGIDQLVQQFDRMRTELIKSLKAQVTDLVRVTPSPPLMLYAEAHLEARVLAERERCARIAETSAGMVACYGEVGEPILLSRASAAYIGKKIREAK